ncbi:hypothetical protein D9M71_533110 [compost metagenome]
MAVEHAQPHRALVAESDRQCVLQVGAAGHRRVTVALRQLDQQAAHGLDITLDDGQCGTHLQDHGGVHDVLGGGAPVHVAAGLATQLRQLFDQRQDRVADDFGFVLHQRQVEGLVARQLGNLHRGFARDDPTACFGLGQGHFDFDVTLDQRFVGEHRTHFGGAEHVTEQGGIENGGGHGQGS